MGKNGEGKKHDKEAVDETDFLYEPGSRLWKDTGFHGMSHQARQLINPRRIHGGRIDPAEKETNHAIARERIDVDHSIGGAKVYRIVRCLPQPSPGLRRLGDGGA